ncbi:hypothetical protein ACTMU2_36740 [Cupriavidus basilensis]
MPTVHLEADFRAISRMGDDDHAVARCDASGSKSITLAGAAPARTGA